MLDTLLPALHCLAIPEFVTDNARWLILGAIVLVGLAVGFGDVLRFSAARVWAISSVSFAESLRRRVLLITPLAIVGIIIVSQLQNPVDAADAIRQTIKVALFATGMLVVIATIIMACTNLPKEIDSRVIYTVVTKPTTRLEIVLGKVLGFARVSALLLLIMGLFTWGYVQFRAWNMTREIRAMVAADRVDDVNRQSYQHYAKAGLVAAKKYERPDNMEVLARIPQPGDATRWIYGSAEQDVLIPFDVDPSQLIGPGFEQITPESVGVVVAEINYVQRALTPEEAREATDEGVDLSSIAQTTQGPLLPSATQPAVQRPAPRVAIQFLDRSRYTLVPAQSVNGGKPITLPPPGQPIEARIGGEALIALARAGQFYIDIIGLSPGTQYGIRLSDKAEQPSVALLIPGVNGRNEIAPAWHDPDRRGQAVIPEFRGRLGASGQQLRGGPEGNAPVAIYTFHDAEINPRPDGTVPFELTVGVEKSGEDADAEDQTHLAISVMDAKTGKVSGPLDLYPESNRTSFFNIPAEWVRSGDFDLIVRNLTPGHWAGIRTDAIAMVVQNQPFAYNLLKSLLILWLLSVLVIVVSIFASTFLSWPIAIVLTLVILLGHWGVNQLGDATGSGIGNQVATDLGFRDPALAKVTSTSVEALNRFLNTVSGFLPDISAFGGTEEVERGVSIPPAAVLHALAVMLTFGIPLTILAYVFLKNKEVAP